MASLPELSKVALVASSDAHSLSQMGREYTDLLVEELSDRGVFDALRHHRISRYTGLPPKIGKYHRSACTRCGILEDPPPLFSCPLCGGEVVMGVLDRITALGHQRDAGYRPPYRHQVPLRRFPGIGPKTLAALTARWPREEDILWQVPPAELASMLSPKVVQAIMAQRQGILRIQPGGGGIYGKVVV